MAMNVGETLLIGYDFSGGKDVDIVTVVKRVNGKIKYRFTHFLHPLLWKPEWIFERRKDYERERYY